MAGYFGTLLLKKLGIKVGFRLAFVNAPDSFAGALGPLPVGVVEMVEPVAPLDLVVLFVDRLVTLTSHFAPLASRLAPAGMIWVSWPKKSSGVVTDVSEGLVRDHGLGVGLVDVKICAIDETWSGLKFVYRLKGRPTRP
ncbi:MAG: hypothetical protein JWN86_398 [Planctomycetota bacterium]|nr:hypothetical protein [Planctomycetota bacterium]